MTELAIDGFEGMTVLIVEDDEIMRLSLEDALRMEGIPVVAAASASEGRRILGRRGIDLVVTDIRLPDGSGADLFNEISANYPGLPVMVMTAYGSVANAVELVKAGAIDYLTKPFDMASFIGAVQRILQARREQRSGGPGQPQGTCLGRSPAMRSVTHYVNRVAPLDSSILITGESGVGKEVVANLIHQRSNRTGHPFIKVNCAAIPLNLVESELFGHEKGAFTGADRRRIGRFEQANGGTIFLDEIAEIPPEVQVKLLRVIQERVLERVGGNEPVALNVRILAATQVKLQAAIEQGTFRADLYWRLNVLNIDVPPLRERPEDILYLARRFADGFSAGMGRRVTGFSVDAESMLMEWPFPGNVRELKNLIERAVALCDGQRIEVHDLFPAAVPMPDARGYASLREAVEEAEREAIRATLARCGGAIGQAAEMLNISRKSLWEKMRRYGIDRQSELG